MTWSAPNLPQEKHCFFGRKGGVSEGIYQSLNTNFKSRDNKENVRRNCEIIAGHYGLKYDNILRLNQGISNKCVFVTQASQNQIEADGAVTATPGIILCIGTADCAPVLLADYKNGVIGAAHAGWRGAFAGIIENTVSLMLQHGAEIANLAAAVGPCIQQPSCEMGSEVLEQFLSQDQKNQKYFIPAPRPEHYLFDLSAYTADKLRRLGIQNIAVSKDDTYADSENYFSYRRNTHLGLIRFPADFPVELSTITL